MNIYSIIRYALMILFLLAMACKQEPSEEKSKSLEKQETKKAQHSSLFFITPVNGQKFTIGDDISIKVSLKDKALTIDSIHYFVNGKPLQKNEAKPSIGNLNTDNALPGKQKISATSYYNDGTKEKSAITIILLSDIIPELYTYKIINTYPHDKNAYTQGLVYEDGILYESTGNYGTSTLRKTALKSGKVIQSYNLPNNIFAEGICLFNDKIIQLTYKAQSMFIYDKGTFNLLREVPAPTLEGWGITNYGNELVMSDGSEILYFMDKEHFSVTRKLEVYDHKGPVNRLNELEYIKGKIYANIYISDDIVIIDPESGKVEARANMKGLLKPSDRHPSIDVFNGIAYDKDNGRLFVTGKNWPRLFEVALVLPGK